MDGQYQRDNTALRKENERLAAELEASRLERSKFHARVIIAEAALRVIGGLASDASPYIVVYRDAGGGYEGLQAIARAAEKDLEELRGG